MFPSFLLLIGITVVKHLLPVCLEYLLMVMADIQSY
jgi:hypothetical protein